MSLLLTTSPVFAQDPTGAIEGAISDRTGSAVPATITVEHGDTGFRRETSAGADGLYRLPLLPIGTYRVTIAATGFGTTVREPVVVTVGQAVRLNVQVELSTVKEAVTVSGGAQLVDTSTNALGRVVTGRELVDLPLNGRNFTQLGLLQTGVAPLTAGVATAGGSLRQGQAYAVNGMRPEQNIYLVDGAQNMNRMDGGYAVKIPVDAIAEFRILTQSAPPEYGGTAGATTSVVTRGGSNQLHGSAYEFVRNDAFDARNFFSSEVEPLDQHQFGATAGGPLRANRAFFFGYYEGFRNRQGLTTTATVPTAQERQGDFSGMSTPLLNFAAGGVPFPNNQIPPAAINPVARNVVNLYPLGNVSPSIYRETVVGNNDYDQAGGRVDFNPSSKDQLFARYAFSGGHNINPVSIRGTDVPGYPTRDDLSTHSLLASSTRIMGSSLTNAVRVMWLRHEFLFDQRLNRHPPSELGFGYESANEIGQGPPFFNVSGYTPIGGAITGPRNSTQTTFEIGDGASWTHGRHLVKVGGELRHTSIDMFQAIAPNAFYVFAGTFPTNNAVANLLLGAPVTFYQGLGDFNRGVRLWNAGAYAQDEWRLGTELTLNYGVRYERINPFTEIEDRLNGFIPGVQSQVRPDAPKGLVFPGDPGVAKGIAEGANTFMPRVGVAWDPTGEGRWSVRSSYGLFYDQFQNGAGTSSQVAISAIPSAQFNQFSGAGLNFANPYQGRPYPAPNTFVRPSTVFAMDVDAKPPYSQNWNLSIQRSLRDRYVVEVRYVGATGSRLPRNVEANPAVYGPGATAQNADRRRIYANCPADGGTCDFSTIAMLRNITSSNFNSGQFSVSRRFSDGFGFNVSVLALEIARPPLGDEPVRRRRQAARRRERPGPESVRPGRGIRTVTIRCQTPLRGQRQLGAAGLGRPSHRAARAARGLANQRDHDAQLGNAVHRVRLRERGAPGQQPADFGVRRQPSRRGRRSERRSTHRRCVAHPGRVQAAGSADAGRAVRQRRTQHRARTRLHQRRSVAGAEHQIQWNRPAAAARRVVQRAQSPELRTSGRGSELAQLRTHPVRRLAAPDAVRGQDHVLTAGSRFAVRLAWVFRSGGVRSRAGRVRPGVAIAQIGTNDGTDVSARGGGRPEGRPV